MSDSEFGPDRYRASSSSFLSNFANRQKFTRCSVYVDGQLISGDEVLDCVILNISLGGAWVRLPQVVKPKEKLTLKATGFGEFQCEVIRQNGKNIGLAFTEPARKTKDIVHAILGRNDIGHENRKFPRRTVLFSGKNYSGVRIFKCRVIDISLGGARVKVDKYFQYDPIVTLRIDRFGDFACEVVWQEDTLLGLAFLDPPAKILNSIGSLLPQG
ncbi:MAG: PilZ domain-containing protein [Rhodospirillales bacterium]|nr:PilZ domain-containing protein [Rhodospirillales bacterium]